MSASLSRQLGGSFTRRALGAGSRQRRISSSRSSTRVVSGLFSLATGAAPCHSKLQPQWRCACVRPAMAAVACRGVASAAASSARESSGHVWGDVPIREKAKGGTGVPESDVAGTVAVEAEGDEKEQVRVKARPVRRRGKGNQHQTELRGGLVHVETEAEHEAEYSDDQTTTYWAPERLPDEEFMVVFEKELDRIEASVEHMKELNEKFEVTRTMGCLQINVGGEYGPYKFQMDVYNQVIRFSSPRSGGLFPYNYHQKTKRWLHHLDGHDMEGLFTRDIIFQAMGCPDLK